MEATESPQPYAHWMLREIHEQPAVLAATLGRYLVPVGSGHAFNEELCGPVRAWLREAHERIVITASGSSRHAGLCAELLIEDLSGIAVDVEYASEYTYRSEQSRQDCAVLVVSQSGETADTLAALRKATAAGHTTLAITNVADSTMAREASVSFPTMASREHAIPATKSFTAQLLNLLLMALMAAESRDCITEGELGERLAELVALPERMAAQLPGWERAVREIAPHYQSAASLLFLGRGIHYPIAREGALKLKESAYLHAEGYPSGELKHGPNALVSPSTPLVMIATVDTASAGSVERYDKTMQLMRDMRAQGATILALANTGDDSVADVATHTIFVEAMREELLPICEVVPLQLLAYAVAVANGVDVDHPRNLTKAVLSE